MSCSSFLIDNIAREIDSTISKTWKGHVIRVLPFVLSQAIAEIPGFCWIEAAVPMFNRVIRAITVSSALGANFPAMVPKDDGLNARPGVINPAQLR